MVFTMNVAKKMLKCNVCTKFAPVLHIINNVIAERLTIILDE